MKRLLPAITRVLLLCMIAIAMLMGAFSWITFAAAETHVALLPGAGAPNASGTAKIGFDGTVMVGNVEVENLPSQPFGSGHFYGVWFVRTDTQDKAFLGALINHKSIILASGGKGDMEFSATHFTTGPNAGSPITFGTSGNNLIVVLIENTINGLTPSPIGPVPGTGVAVGGTF